AGERHLPDRDGEALEHGAHRAASREVYKLVPEPQKRFKPFNDPGPFLGGLSGEGELGHGSDRVRPDLLDPRLTYPAMLVPEEACPGPPEQGVLVRVPLFDLELLAQEVL